MSPTLESCICDARALLRAASRAPTEPLRLAYLSDARSTIDAARAEVASLDDLFAAFERELTRTAGHAS